MKASEFITKHTVAEARRSAVDQMPQGFGGGGAGGGRPAVWRDNRFNQAIDPNFGKGWPTARGDRRERPIEPAASDRSVSPELIGLGGASVAGGALYQAGQSSETGKDQNTDSRPQTQTQTGSSGRGDTGMPRAKPNDGVAVATDKGLRGTTTARQEPKTADDLAHFSKGVFATRADRLNQAKVDSVLGPGYRAGTAAANRALADYFRQERAREVMAKEAERILQLSGLRDREQQELDQELAQRQSQQSLRDPEQQ